MFTIIFIILKVMGLIKLAWEFIFVALILDIFLDR
jgi:hypothetical protein